MKKPSGISIFLTIMIGLLVVAFYYVIETQERPQSKTQVSRIIRNDFFKNKPALEELVAFAMTPNAPDSWYFDNRGDSLQYGSESYINGNYAFTSVPVFKVVPGLAGKMDALQLCVIRSEKEEGCDKRVISFTYKEGLFSPDGRYVSFRYFPDGICKQEMESIQHSDVKWNWSFYLDKNWVAKSSKPKH